MIASVGAEQNRPETVRAPTTAAETPLTGQPNTNI